MLASTENSSVHKINCYDRTMLLLQGVTTVLSLTVLLPSTTALIEPDTSSLTPVSLASFINASAIPESNTVFLSASASAVPRSFASDLSRVQERLGIMPGSTKLDARSGKMVNLNTKKAILPGNGVGNHLLWSVGMAEEGYGAPTSNEEWSMLGVEAVKNWLIKHQDDLQIDASNDLFAHETLFEGGSAPTNIRTAVHGDDGDMIQISMERSYKGVRVVGSRASATIKMGNLVNVGLERWGDIEEGFDVHPRLTHDDAHDAVAVKTGLMITDEVTCNPELQIITISQGDFNNNALRPTDVNRVRVRFGNGYAHKLIWRVCPKFEGQVIEKMEGIVDAITGQVYSFQDTIDYFQAKGAVYPLSNDGIGSEGSLQDGWPMPFMQVGSEVTDMGGNYFSAGPQIAQLAGPYVEMRDICGDDVPLNGITYGVASLTQSEVIDWSGSGGSDCSTPDFGSLSNTHSSRTGFYELNKIIEIARSRLPTNSWLQGKLLAYMNIESSCNAYWDGTVNFYRSGGACANTGEIAGVFDHEWGHGLDNNDVDGQIAEPSGEGIADLYAALRLNDSCIGRGFFKASVCSHGNNQCLTCSGVRDIDYKKHQMQTPSTFTWSNTWCSGSVHCLGSVYSEAVWSLYTRELNAFYGYDENTRMEIVTRLTYIAAGNTGTWFGGSPPYGGCGSNSGYLAYLAADDDNGNINDGTPHMKAIFKVSTHRPNHLLL